VERKKRECSSSRREERGNACLHERRREAETEERGQRVIARVFSHFSPGESER